jgi:hypothetical protein
LLEQAQLPEEAELLAEMTPEDLARAALDAIGKKRAQG